MLRRIQFDNVNGVNEVNLDAPELRKVQLTYCCPGLRLEIVHAGSVGLLETDFWSHVAVEKLKNLKCLCVDGSKIDSTFLSNLKQLEEIHLFDFVEVSELFKQKDKCSRDDLNIYYFGLQLNDADDSAIKSDFVKLEGETVAYLAANLFRLADEIPLQSYLNYTGIERVEPSLAINIMRKFIDLNEVIVREPVQDIERFMDLLGKFDNIVLLQFLGNQPQALFDRLPEHSFVQQLIIRECQVQNFQFLLKFRRLIHLELGCSIDVKLIRKVLEELDFPSNFTFKYRNMIVRILIDHYPKLFEVLIRNEAMAVPDVNDAIQWIIRKANLF